MEHRPGLSGGGEPTTALYSQKNFSLLSAFCGELVQGSINHLCDEPGIWRLSPFSKPLPCLLSRKPAWITTTFLRSLSAVDFQKKSCDANFSGKGIVSQCALGVEVMGEMVLFNRAFCARFLPGLAGGAFTG